MGRRKDDPLLQAAKGFPGRRRSKVEKEIENAADAAAEMQATPDDPFPIPDVFKKSPAYWAEAIRVWKEKSEVLLKAGRRRPGYRRTLARYCMWTQFYVSAAEQLRRDLPKGGSAIKVKKGDGETVIRTHPNVDFMAKAETASPLGRRVRLYAGSRSGSGQGGILQRWTGSLASRWNSSAIGRAPAIAR